MDSLKHRLFTKSQTKILKKIIIFSSCLFEIKKKTLGKRHQPEKNLGRLWHAYIRTTGQFYKLTLTSFDSWRFTQSYLSLGWSDLHKIKNVSFCISSHDQICYICQVGATGSYSFYCVHNSTTSTVRNHPYQSFN